MADPSPRGGRGALRPAVGLQGPPARSSSIHLLPLRVVFQPAQGRGPADAGPPAPGPGPRDVLERCQRLQRPVPGRSAGLHRLALVRGVPRRGTLGGLSPVLPAFSGAPGPDEPVRHPPQPALPAEPRRHPARPDEPAPPLADPARPPAPDPRPPPRRGREGVFGRPGREAPAILEEGDARAARSPGGGHRVAPMGASGDRMGRVLRRDELHRRRDRPQARDGRRVPRRGPALGRLGPGRQHRPIQPTGRRARGLHGRPRPRPRLRRAELPRGRRAARSRRSSRSGST